MIRIDLNNSDLLGLKSNPKLSLGYTEKNSSRNFTQLLAKLGTSQIITMILNNLLLFCRNNITLSYSIHICYLELKSHSLSIQVCPALIKTIRIQTNRVWKFECLDEYSTLWIYRIENYRVWDYNPSSIFELKKILSVLFRPILKSVSASRLVIPNLIRIITPWIDIGSIRIEFYANTRI